MSGPFSVDITAGHQVLGKRCYDEIAMMSAASLIVSPYTLRYGVKHLVDAGPGSSAILDKGEEYGLLHPLH